MNQEFGDHLYIPKLKPATGSCPQNQILEVLLEEREARATRGADQVRILDALSRQSLPNDG